MNQHFQPHKQAQDALAAAMRDLFVQAKCDDTTDMHILEDKLGVFLPAVKDAVLSVMKYRLPSHLFVSALSEVFDELTNMATQECEMQREDMESARDAMMDARLAQWDD